MNIDKYKHTHVDILQRIDRLRQLTRGGVETNASAIAQTVVALSSVVKLHLAAEDRALYPSLQKSGDAQLMQLGQRFQSEMGPIAADFDNFAHAWNTAQRVKANGDGFRAAANDTLRRVYERMRQEDREFYPVIEASAR